MTKKEREEKREKKLLSLLAFDEDYYTGGKVPAGMDEVGRGPLAGPVVSACVCMKKDSGILGIDDSKKVTELNRIKLFDRIIEDARAVGVGIVSQNIIDGINILNATKLAMKAAFYDMLCAERSIDRGGLISSYESLVSLFCASGLGIVPSSDCNDANHERFALSKIIAETKEMHYNMDGSADKDSACTCGASLKKNDIVLLIDAVELEDVGAVHHSVVKGDEKSYSIAAASIVAKVIRDEIMKRADEIYPGYDLKSNKGYGTKKHYEGIKLYGISDIHRKTFVR